MDLALQLWTRLCEDPLAQQRLADDPESFARWFGVDAGELERWTEQCSAELAGTWQRCAMCGDPGNDDLPDPDPPIHRD